MEIFELNSKGHLKHRESFDLDFKSNFHYGDSLIDYVKSMEGMANNKGGEIVFGVADKPRIPKGLDNDKFEKCDPKTFNQVIQEYFSHEIHWDMNSFEFKGKTFGRIVIHESIVKPVICKKTNGKLVREGAIYYRYRGETKEINFTELFQLIEDERRKEKMLWMNHIEKIGQVGPQNIHLIDTYKGEIHVGDGKLLIDKGLIDKLKFVREGKFVETDGAPTLKLIGEISGVVDPEMILPPDKVYPLLTKDLETRLGLNSYQINCVLWKLKIKGNARYHTEIKPGKKSNPINKYTEDLISKLQTELKNPDFLTTAMKEFKISHPSKGRGQTKRKV